MIHLLMLSSAHPYVAGDMAPACTFDRVTATLPAAEELDVATDIVPTFFLSDCGAVSSTGTASVYVDDELVHEQSVEDIGGVYSFIEVDVLLEPDTDYEIWLAPDGGGEDTLLSFSTGSRSAELGAGAPVVDDGVDWEWYRKSKVASFFLEFDAAVDPEGVSYVEAIGPDDEIWGTVLVLGEGPHYLSGDVAQESRPRDVCLTLSHRQADGSFVEGDTVCEDGRVGCSTGALGAALMPALFGLLMLRRRR